MGNPGSSILESEPFKAWPVEKSVEDDLEERIIHYVFNGNGLELRCDSDDKVSVAIARRNKGARNLFQANKRFLARMALG